MPSSTLPLKDIHLPEAIQWWPPALGWWLLAAVILISIALFIWLYKQLTRKTVIKAAKKQLLIIKQDTNQDNLQKLTSLSSLLRRTTISLYPRTDTASLTGQQWLAFLDRSVKGAPFSDGIGQLLKDAHYQKTPPEELNISELLGLCENWLNAQTKHLKSIKRKNT